MALTLLTAGLSKLSRACAWLVLVLSYFLIVTPAGLVLKLCRRDPLRLRGQAARQSYWIDRKPKPSVGVSNNRGW